MLLANYPIPIYPSWQMGIDTLDIIFRLEKRFDIKIPRNMLFEEPWNWRRGDLQVGQLHEQVCSRLKQLGWPIPRSSWHRVKLCVAESLGVELRKVRPESWLFKELGCS